MKKTIILALALALLGGAAYANFGARDTVPAATLLVPYIVVDMNSTGPTAAPDPNGYTTLTVVTNVSSTAQLIHVSVYSAASQGIVDFDEVLSGYDVWQINWRDLLTGDFENFDTGSATDPSGAATPYGKNGFWSTTDPNDIAAPKAPQPFGPTMNNNPSFNGLNAAMDIDSLNLTNCGFPWGNLHQYAGLIVQGLQSPLLNPIPGQDADCNTGGTLEIPAWGGWLSNLSPQPLFFYALIDSVNICQKSFPNETAFWPISGSILTDLNTLTGYDIYMKPPSANGGNYSESLPTVNLEAKANYNYPSFYSKYKKGVDALAAREPLPTAWAFNFMNNSDVTTEVAVWKNYSDFETKGTSNVVLAARPYIYYAFDENENSLANNQKCPSGAVFCSSYEPNVFPFETQKVAVNSTNFDGLPPTAPGTFGWMLLVFDPSISVNTTNGDSCTNAGAINTAYFQSYVFAKYNYGTYSTSVEATAMSSLTSAQTQSTLPALNTYDGLLSQ